MDLKLIVLTGICLLAGYCQGSETPLDATSTTNLATETTSSTTIPPQPKIWVVVDKTTDETCIVAQIKIQFKLSYPVEIKADANITTANTIVMVPLDKSTEATGLCNNTLQKITLVCKENAVKIGYKLKQKRHFVYLIADDLSNCSGKKKVSVYQYDDILYEAQVEMFYKCDKVHQVNVTVFSRRSSAILTISHRKMEGLDFWPKPLNTDVESNLLRVNSSDEQNIQHWTSQLDNLLEEYNYPQRGENVEECYYERSFRPGRVCNIRIRDLYPCSSENKYNYHRGGPCILLKINEIYGWKPIMYNESTKLPDKMPQELKNYIEVAEKIKPFSVNTVWVSCEGENPADVENIGPINYIPKHGFPWYFFPYLNQEGYLNPIVFLHFQRPAIGVRINVVCKAWAHNIDNDGPESTGSIHFAIMVERTPDHI